MYVGSRTPGWLYALGIPPRTDFPLRTPRARATDLGPGPNLRAGSGRAPCVPRSREHEEGAAAGREKNAEGPKKHIYIYIYVQGSISRFVSREIPGVTQVENGHSGNTAAVAKVHLCWVKTWSKNQQGRSSCWLLLKLFALNIWYLFVAFVSEAFFGLKKASNWLVSLTNKNCRECKPSSNRLQRRNRYCSGVMTFSVGRVSYR